MVGSLLGTTTIVGVVTEIELLGAVDDAFEVTGRGLVPWPDPHPDRSPLDEEYSRLADPHKWRIVGARADAWLVATADLGLATGQRRAEVRWAALPGTVISRTDRVTPHAPGALPLIVARSQLEAVDDAGITFASRTTGHVGALTLDGDRTWTTDIGGSARGLLATPDVVLVAGPAEDSVVKLSRPDGKVLASAEVGGAPWDLADLGDQGVAVGLANGEGIAVLDPDDLTVTASHPSVAGAREVHLTNAGLWLVGNPRGQVVLLDPVSFETIWSTSIPPAELYAVSTDDQLILRAGGGDIWVYDGPHVKRMRLGPDFIALAVDPLGRLAVSNAEASTIEFRSLEPT